jgi:hypothetical protein
VFSGQVAVCSRSRGISRRHGERGGLAAAHEGIKQKLTKETKGVVCYSRPEAGVNSVQFSAERQRNSHGVTESAEDSAFLDDQLEAEARIFTRGNFLGTPHGGHGFARELRRRQTFHARLRFWLGDGPLRPCVNL